MAEKALKEIEANGGNTLLRYISGSEIGLISIDISCRSDHVVLTIGLFGIF